ncbi:hypothetical protein FE251_09215 [Georgenia wutianyii]|uniref:Uncharacterized protein n=1 Tax=Georgenia wutianyii TaxID=2585135 RepID=A0ABX5VMU9_9MICO|nr:hypothetical protein [Georgenia wutianyii]QDB79533.1 hypothetical protein FE251_09215 [Georgenia wutianyii]
MTYPLTLPDPCPLCSGPVTYSGRGRRPVYCSPACKRKAETEIRRQERARAFGVRECPVCGLPVTYSGKGRRPTFCGPVCSNTTMADEYRARRYYAEIRKANRHIFRYVPPGRRVVEDPITLSGSIIPPEQARMEARSAALSDVDGDDGGSGPVLKGRIPGTVPARWAERQTTSDDEAATWLKENDPHYRVGLISEISDPDERAAERLAEELDNEDHAA